MNAIRFGKSVSLSALMRFPDATALFQRESDNALQHFWHSTFAPVIQDGQIDRHPAFGYDCSMAYDEFTAQRVRNAMPSDLEVNEIKMMGGLIFMVNGNMCCGVVGKDLMVRIGQEAYNAALTEPHVRPMEIGGGRKPRAFIRVGPDGHEHEQQLASWLSRGIAFVSSLPTKKSAR